MAHQPKKDPFALYALLLGLAILGVTVFSLLSNLMSTIDRNSVKGAEDNTRQMAVANESLKPIGNVTLEDKSKPKVARTGDEVYKAVCTSCHGTGILESPKFGDKAQWAPRVANGLPSLIKIATEGKGSMPARGGDPTITDAELKAAILYMTKEAGFDLGGEATDKAPAAEKKAEAPVVAAPAPAATKPAEPVVSAPKETAAPATPVVAVPKAPAAPESAKVAKPEAPAPEAAPVKVAKPAAPTPEVAPVKIDAPTAPAITDVKEVPAAPVAKTASGKSGEEIYKSTCFACHATGVAGSPLFGDKALWAPRIATGMDALYNSSIKGKGAMPPKGGALTLSDDEVKAGVDYMVEHAK